MARGFFSRFRLAMPKARALVFVVFGPSACTTLSGDCDLNLTCDSYKETCGNGVLEIGEACDSGEANSDTTPNACRKACILPACGDGVVDDGEVCDGPSDDPHVACAPTCAVIGCVVGTDAYPTIQSAADDDECDTIVVPAGTYSENVTIARDVSVIGVGAAPPVLDGGQSGTTVTIETGAVTLTSLVITGGLADLGGGVSNKGNLTIEGCAVQGNAASGVNALGGGVFNTGTLTLTGSSVSDNTATLGGGLFSAGGAVILGATEVTANTVSPEAATVVPSRVAGGGVHVEGGSLLLHEGTRVAENLAQGTADESFVKDFNVLEFIAEGGGVYAEDCTVEIDDAEVTENEASAALDIAPDAMNLLDPHASAAGAGISLATSDLSLRNGAQVRDNLATAVFVSAPSLGVGGDVDAIGGGIKATSSSISITEGSEVSANTVLAALADGAVVSDFANYPATGGGLSAGAGSTISVEDSALEDNVAEGGSARGGAVDLGTSTTLTLLRSSVRGNAATGTNTGALGGAVLANNATIDAEDCLFSENKATGAAMMGSASGGAFYVSSGTSVSQMRLTLRRSTVANNEATGASVTDGTATGGAIRANAGTGSALTLLTLINSTLSGNVARGSAAGDGTGRAGAIFLDTSTGMAHADLQLFNTTVTDNRAEGTSAITGGIELRRGISDSVTSALFRSSIVSGNLADTAPDCRTSEVTITCWQTNFVSDIEGCTLTGTANVGVDPMLLPLDDYGGSTETHMLAAGSPAVDTNGACNDENGDALLTDQRGLPRSGACDAGAVERQPGDP